MNVDYHVEIDKHFYSVPFRLLREEVEARITAKTVEMGHAHAAENITDVWSGCRSHNQNGGEVYDLSFWVRPPPAKAK